MFFLRKIFHEEMPNRIVKSERHTLGFLPSGPSFSLTGALAQMITLDNSINKLKIAF